MNIVFRLENGVTRWPCCICHGPVEQRPIYAIVEKFGGPPGDYVCEGCIAAGPEGMKKRAIEAAKRWVRDASDFLAWARTFQGEGIDCPTLEDWETAEAEYAREREREMEEAERQSACELRRGNVPVTQPEEVDALPFLVFILRARFGFGRPGCGAFAVSYLNQLIWG